MDKENNINQVAGAALNGFSLVSSTGIFWKSRKRAADGRDLDKVTNNTAYEILNQQEETAKDDEKMQEATSAPELSERRKALFEPLEPITIVKGQQPPAESLLPPPDFDAACYPKGWLVGKKRKLVNVDVVESMRRIAIQEMNRKDREIDGLNEQLEEDSRCLEHLQVQLLEERSKRARVERDNTMLQEQIAMLMNMLQENEAIANEDVEDEGHDEP